MRAIFLVIAQACLDSEPYLAQANRLFFLSLSFLFCSSDHSLEVHRLPGAPHITSIVAVS
jgi:hypothetical protein